MDIDVHRRVVRLSVRVVGVVGQVQCNVEVVHDFQVGLYCNF